MRDSRSTTMYSAQGYQRLDARGFFYSHLSGSI
jgi:hypothetical protein